MRDRKSNHAPCSRECGRMTRALDGVCDHCKRGHRAEEPNPAVWRTEYLLLCVAEITRRRDELNAAIEKARSA